MPVRLNQTVYVVITSRTDGPFILKTKVYMKNSTHFVIPEILEPTVIDECKVPFDIEGDYGRTYFKTIREAKEHFKKKGMLVTNYDGSKTEYIIINNYYKEDKQ